jgi:hypothetical protein
VIAPTTTEMMDALSRECVRCSARATVCAECMRATALMWFGGIARHPESGADCKLCAQGPASYCGNCFVEEVASYRTALREAGNPVIGEPSLGSHLP